MARAVVQPSARSEPLLRAAVLALRAADRDMRREISRGTREQGNVIWKGEIDRRARTSMDRLILAKGARIKAGNPSQAIAASSRRPLSDGLIPDQDGGAWEWGSGARDRTTTYTRGGPRAGRVTRHTRRQLPGRIAQGRVVYAAWARTGPRLVSLWTQTIIRTIHDALEQGE